MRRRKRACGLTPQQRLAAEDAISFYGSIGLFLHNHAKQQAPYIGKQAPLNGLTAQELGKALYCDPAE